MNLSNYWSKKCVAWPLPLSSTFGIAGLDNRLYAFCSQKWGPANGAHRLPRFPKSASSLRPAHDPKRKTIYQCTGWWNSSFPES
eukprot:scaffold1469_cov119-Cylindrotheca_fusiformis.AAC.42